MNFVTGFHVVYVRVRAKVATSFQCSFERIQSDGSFIISPPDVLPDIVDKKLFGDWLSIPIFNSGSIWLHVSISIDSDKGECPDFSLYSLI